jgi:phosphonate transport system substrate-binding protein
MSRRLAYALLAVLLTLLAVNGLVMQQLVDISAPPPPQPPPADHVAGLASRPLVRVGVISRFAPNVIYAGYQPIMDYLNRHGAHRYELSLSGSYFDAVERLSVGDVAASFLGSWIFGRLEADTELVPLVAPLNADGRSDFHAVLVVGPDSPVRTLADLRGRRVAVPSDQSWSGNWLQRGGLASAGLAPADLDTIRHFDHHQTVAWQVLRGQFDAGVVKESVAAEFRREGLREVARSGAIPGPPLAACARGPQAVIEEMRNLLLALDPRDPDDRAVLAGWSPEFFHGFTAVSRGRYLATFGDGAAAAAGPGVEAPR